MYILKLALTVESFTTNCSSEFSKDNDSRNDIKDLKKFILKRNANASTKGPKIFLFLPHLLDHCLIKSNLNAIFPHKNLL